MFRIIHPNRWFIWTIALIVMIFIVVWGAVERYAIEQETETAGQNSLLGRETSKLDTTGWKTYRGENFGLVNSVGLELPGLELRYPPEWKVESSESLTRIESSINGRFELSSDKHFFLSWQR